VGHQIQRIEKECYACGGRGVGGRYGDEPGDECYRCGGDGVWEVVYWKLERWSLGGRTFHRPAGRATRLEYEEAADGRPGTLRPIDGLVEHRRPKGFRAREAALWLALLFDRPYFLRLMLGGWTRGLTPCPLVLIQRLVAPACLRLGVTHRAMIDDHRGRGHREARYR
jgi:hypothetical protein